MAVTISFSRNARYVLTGSKDWNVCVWDLASETDPPKRKAMIRFDAPVVSAYFHPRNRCVSTAQLSEPALKISPRSQIILVVLAPGEAYIVDLRKQHRGREELCEPPDENESEEDEHNRRCATQASPWLQGA